MAVAVLIIVGVGARRHGDEGVGARRVGDKGVGACRAGDEVGGRSCWWGQEQWPVMLAMRASMTRAMDARAGDVVILLGEAWAGCRSFLYRGGGLGRLPILYRGRGLGKLPILYRRYSL